MKSIKNFYVASFLEKRFDLSSGIFKKMLKRKTKTDAKIKVMHGVTFVILPEEAHQHIKDGYISVKIDKTDKQEDYSHIFELTSKTKIGFYK